MAGGLILTGFSLMSAVMPKAGQRTVKGIC
jgi:hypothetical protein